MKFIVCIVVLFPSILAAMKPNIVLILSDDQDIMLGGVVSYKLRFNLELQLHLC